MAVPKTVGEIIAVPDGGVSQDGSSLRPARRHPERAGQVFMLDVSTGFFRSRETRQRGFVASVVDAN